MPYVALTVDDFYTGDYRRLTASHILEAANAAHAALTLCPAGSGTAAPIASSTGAGRGDPTFVAQGPYELCDHTYSHPVLPRLTLAAQEQEILAGQASIQRFFGRAPSSLIPASLWQLECADAGGRLSGGLRPDDYLVDR